MKAGVYMQSLIWCCGSCGFTLKGGQPSMECPICEAYKASNIDIPQHIEAALIEEFGADLTNSAEARKKRLQLLEEGGYRKKSRLKGRVTEAVHQAGDSRKYL